MNYNVISLLTVLFAGEICASGPGLQQSQYTEDQLFQPLGRFGSSKPGYRGHASVGMFHGYLAGVESRDSGLGDGAIAFFDVSNPAEPKRVATHEDEHTKVLYEGHNYGYVTIEGKDIVCMVAQKGIQLWDWSDIQHLMVQGLVFWILASRPIRNSSRLLSKILVIADCLMAGFSMGLLRLLLFGTFETL